jgi:hypothetical protein
MMVARRRLRDHRPSRAIIALVSLLCRGGASAVAMIAKQLAIPQVSAREADDIAQPCMCRLVVESSQPNHGS